MPRARRVNLPLLLVSLGMSAGIVLIVIGLSAAVTGRDSLRLPDEIEAINPVDGDRVLRQTRVIVDFVPGYEAVLVINGIELPTVRLDELTTVEGMQPAPGEQVVIPPVAVYDPGNASIGFQPTRGALIEEFSQGLHRATVIYWRIEEGRERARQYSWTFSVT